MFCHCFQIKALPRNLNATKHLIACKLIECKC